MALAAAGTAAIVAVVAAAPRNAAAGEELRALRGADAAARAAAVRAIVAKPRDELKADAAYLRTALRRALSKDDAPDVRGLAARALFHIEGDGAIAPVLEAMRTERDPVAEALLAAAWAGIASDPARLALVEATIDAADPRTAALAGEALGALGAGAGADDALVLASGSLSWPAAAGVCLGLRGVRRLAAVDCLVARAGHRDAAVRSAARESLVFLTGEDRGPNPREWEAWWDAAREGFRFPDGPPAPAPGAPAPGHDAKRTTDRPAGAGSPTWAEFFGLPIRGSRVAFVIDYSQSMWGERRAKAEAELIDAVKSLPSTARVTVILFNEKVWLFRPQPVPARPQEKFDLARLLPELETKSYTNLYDAVEEALGLLGAGRAARDPAPGLDDVVVLTDGVPNRGRYQDEERICTNLREMNAGRARISCVALAAEGAALLRRLAKENAGGFASAPVAK